MTTPFSLGVDKHRILFLACKKFVKKIINRSVKNDENGL